MGRRIKSDKNKALKHREHRSKRGRIRRTRETGASWWKRLKESIRNKKERHERDMLEM